MSGIKSVIGMAMAGMMLFCMPSVAGAWTLPGSNGRTLSPATYPGKWVLINFWATWCADCRKEIPGLIRLQHDDAVKMTVIGVAVSYYDPKKVLGFAHKEGMNYPIVLGNGDTVAEFGGIRGLPESFLYAPDGTLVQRFEGPVTESMIMQAIKQGAKQPSS